ncbi:MAG: GTPase, partial [Clostridiales bacterium]
GVPNTGKSTLMNALMPKNVGKTGNHPGVTRGKQWVRIGTDLELLDTPGVLWPKFDDPTVAFALAVTGAISMDVLDEESVACSLIRFLSRTQPEALQTRYKITTLNSDPFLVLTDIGKSRGLLAGGGKIKTNEAAALFLAEFRNGKLGRFTIDQPPLKV